MKFYEAEAVFRSIKCGIPGMRLDCESEISRGFIHFVISYEVPERDTRQRIRTRLDYEMPVDERLTEEHIIDTVRRLLHETVTHEVDEQFTVLGKRIFDPHVSRRRR